MWDLPPKSKVYEALGAVADGRIRLIAYGAECTSSNGNKKYEIRYNAEENSIVANDNGSYWKGYLGYPAISFLFVCGILPYREDLGNLFKGVPWKDTNQLFNNDFDKAIEHIFKNFSLETRGELERYAEETLSMIGSLGFKKLSIRTKPPRGY